MVAVDDTECDLQAALQLPEPAAATVSTSGAGVAAAPRLGGGMWSHLPAVAQSGVRGRVAVLWTGERHLTAAICVRVRL